MTDHAEALALADEIEPVARAICERQCLRAIVFGSMCLKADGYQGPCKATRDQLLRSWRWAAAEDAITALRSQSPAPAPMPDERKLREEIARLREEKGAELCDAVCDSYARENQQFYDRIHAVESALAEERAKREAERAELLNALRATVAPLAASASQWPRGMERLQLVEAAITKAENQP